MTRTAAPANQPAYDPNHLLDILLGKLQLKNDAALAHKLEVAPPVISKIRHQRLPVGASMLIRMHEASGMSIRDLREVMGAPSTLISSSVSPKYAGARTAA